MSDRGPLGLGRDGTQQFAGSEWEQEMCVFSLNILPSVY